MARADSAPGVAVEVFVKEHQVAPVRIVWKLETPKTGRRPFSSRRKMLQAARHFAGHLPQSHHLSRPGRELNLEIVTKVVVEFLQRFDQQKFTGNQMGPRQLELPPNSPVSIRPARSRRDAPCR